MLLNQVFVIYMDKSEYHYRVTPVADEVHLRRLTVDEALFKLDKYLNDAFVAGLYQVRVIHGKGTGTLRDVVPVSYTHLTLPTN